MERTAANSLRLCETTSTPRRACSLNCGTYPGNLGPCDKWQLSANDRCLYCDHGMLCHIAAGKPARLDVNVFQHDWMPGFAAFHDDGELDQTAKAHVSLSIGNFLGAVNLGELHPADLPYAIAETLMHEVVHVFESWAGVEFSEERVDALLAKYRAEYVPSGAQYVPCEPQNAPAVSLLSGKINALPEWARDYIHNLETRADPAGEVAMIASLREQRDALVLLVEELRGRR